jgi:hypothetical protein
LRSVPRLPAHPGKQARSLWKEQFDLDRDLGRAAAMASVSRKLVAEHVFTPPLLASASRALKMRDLKRFDLLTPVHGRREAITRSSGRVRGV